MDNFSSVLLFLRSAFTAKIIATKKNDALKKKKKKKGAETLLPEGPAAASLEKHIVFSEGLH